MNPSALFIRRPVATVLLTLGIALVGIAAYFALPVASLPAVDFPTIQVQAQLPGASPLVMASSVATPLERRLGQISDVSELTSSSSLGRTNITIQFGTQPQHRRRRARRTGRHQRRSAPTCRRGCSKIRAITSRTLQTLRSSS